MTDTVLAQLAALKSAPVADLKQKWRTLFDREPPPYNRRFLEGRLGVPHPRDSLTAAYPKKQSSDRTQLLTNLKAKRCVAGQVL